MAVTSVLELVHDRTAAVKPDERTYRRVFLVTTDSLKDGPQTARLDRRVPRLGDPYVAGSDVDAGALWGNCQYL